MPSSEDYLDGLLNSINQKKSDVTKAQHEEQENIKAKIADMNSVDPNDDFMEATGISGFRAGRMSHDNLREAFSESEFLKEFEEELSSGSADDFIRDFEQEIDDEEARFQRGEEIPDDAGSEFIRSLMSEDGIDYDEMNSEDGAENATTDAVDNSEGDVQGNDAGSEDNSDDASGADVSVDSENITDDAEENSTSDITDDAEESSTSDITDDAAETNETNEAIEAFNAIREDLANDSDTTDQSDGATPEESVEESADEEQADMDDAAELLSALGDDESTENVDDVDTDEELKNILEEVENIVGEDGDKQENDAPESEESGDSILSKEYQSDEHDAVDSLEVNEDGISLVDENIDLDELLASEGTDIGDLLNADENDIELDEARDAFEESAEKAESATESDNGESVSGAKEGFFAKLLGIFKKKKDEEDAKELLDVAGNNDIEDTTEENRKILEEMDEEDADELARKQAKAEAKAEKKAAKKAAKEEKKAAREAAKNEKANKEKKPGKLASFIKDDKSNKVPTKVIIVFVLLVGTLVALIIIGSNIYSKRAAINEAKAEYSAGDYIGAYNSLSGVDGLSEEDLEIYYKARLLADLQNKKKEYDTFMAKKDYQNAFDALVVAVGRYNENLETAKEYGITAEYNGIESMIVGQLMDQFGVTDEDAKKLYEIKGRTKYTVAINDKLKALGMLNSNGSNN